MIWFGCWFFSCQYCCIIGVCWVLELDMELAEWSGETYGRWVLYMKRGDGWFCDGFAPWWLGCAECYDRLTLVRFIEMTQTAKACHNIPHTPNLSCAGGR